MESDNTFCRAGFRQCKTVVVLSYLVSFVGRINQFVNRVVEKNVFPISVKVPPTLSLNSNLLPQKYCREKKSVFGPILKYYWGLTFVLLSIFIYVFVQLRLSSKEELIGFSWELYAQMYFRRINSSGLKNGLDCWGPDLVSVCHNGKVQDQYLF